MVSWNGCRVWQRRDGWREILLLLVFKERKMNDKKKKKKKIVAFEHILALPFTITFLHPQHLLLLLRSAHVSIAPVLFHPIPSRTTGEERQKKIPSSIGHHHSLVQQLTFFFPIVRLENVSKFSVHYFCFHSFFSLCFGPLSCFGERFDSWFLLSFGSSAKGHTWTKGSLSGFH